MTGFSDTGRHRVAVAVRPELLPLELGIVHQIFGDAESPDGQPLYEVLTCTPEPGLVTTKNEFSINVAHGLDIMADADTVVVTAAYEDEESFARNATLAKALAALPSRVRVASICTGAFVLAQAGLLDGLRVTTHWKAADELRRHYPRIDVDPDVLYVDNGRILSSAGEAAGIDLCLHMVRKDFGTAVANDIARRTVVPPHRDGGQAQFIARPVPEPRSASTAKARAWALSQLHRPVTLRELAARESMSTRNFTRRFREEVGMSPQQWLTQQRVERARQLLETTDLSIDRVAIDAGFGTGTSLRQHLHAALGVSPRAYRNTFRGQEALAG
ncbi:MAG TPA: helix-turn-helix domain-containing protein [Stackebrandtia sp.]|jgi:transcriptional regulator GlxA family with amidase domain|uniref:GlxA family transcriptional regulator n=1 Tax=Stackebrandtia sp. TaxID=2023065 RepID=UPI002D6501EA|nr:helix-turn-helix domain-containing protein [Stackebrandtia sp.]HZE41272.1 helix-turn-helix domain-containing protein [Stackebrandtia sp.]